ncbi:patatin-like phospholipase family protein [Chitinimonas arctica]|uniref:Patatin-like phospholipase family protein n=1 Tax=Chitinimonas arctica TaxID=2594795 RepID=A0A516SIW7_9NEIS|nr:patatin-like phospholipase family protein [Chitinimonas arctica]QDQ28105.1 patatin-like phospholipase family protein [Chitinimonas arctica]
MSLSPAIHIVHGSPLVWRAGARVMTHVRAQGLAPADIGLIPGAAGGPKALALTGLDQAIFGEWLPRAPRLRHLLGSSIGAWRFVCAMQSDPARALANLAERYTAEHFDAGAGPIDVALSLRRMLDDLFQDAPAALLDHPDYALTLTTVRARGLLASEGPKTQLGGVLAAAAANMLSRRLYAAHWMRVWFADPRHPAPPLSADFPTHIAPLRADNLFDALHATAAIPLVVAGVRDPKHAPPGQYRDGGLLDYHLDLPYTQLPFLVLYPHFYPHIVPGWFDKRLPWRRAKPHRLDNVLLVAPSPAWVAQLPYGKIPDRDDFRRLDRAERQKYWRQVTSETARLGDAFLAAVDGERLATMLQPF